MERQMDVYDVLLDETGNVCPDCPDPASCQAMGECSVNDPFDLGLWDEVPA